MQKTFIVVSLLGLLAGCQQSQVHKKSRAGRLQESIARLSDIPDAPLHVTVSKVVASKQIPENLQVFYTFQARDKEEVKKFYMEEMERFGWRLHFEFDGEQELVEFVKPNGMVSLLMVEDRKLIITLIKNKDVS